MKKQITIIDFVLTVETFIAYCESGFFTDEDGFYYLVCEDNEKFFDVSKKYYPSEVKNLPPNTKKIVWFNN